MEEQKEYQTQIKVLTQENQQLKLQLIDITQFESWKHEQIIAWIMSLEDGRFKKYNDILSKCLSEEDVKGVDLKSVDVIDIRGWGVVNFSDRKALFGNIKSLVNGNNDNDNGNNDDNDNLNQEVPIANKEGAESGGFHR